MGQEIPVEFKFTLGCCLLCFECSKEAQCFRFKNVIISVCHEGHTKFIKYAMIALNFIGNRTFSLRIPCDAHKS